MRRLDAAAMFLALAGCAPEPVSVESLVDANTAARGGAAAIEQVRSIVIRFELTEPGFTVQGRYVADRDGRMRVDIYEAGTRVYTEAFDGQHGWQRAKGDSPAQPTSAQGTAALRHGIESPFKLYGLHELAGRGHRLRSAGKEVVDGIEYRLLEVSYADGQDAGYYLDPRTGLIDRERRRRALHVDLDATVALIETQHLDYRPVSGVLYPYRQVERDLEDGRVLATIVVESIEVNEPLDPAVYLPDPA